MLEISKLFLCPLRAIQGIEGMNFGGAEKLEKLPVVKWVLPAQCSQLQSISLLARLIFLDAFAGERLRVSFSMRFAALKEDQLTFTDPYDMGLSQKVEDMPIARSPVKEGPPIEARHWTEQRAPREEFLHFWLKEAPQRCHGRPNGADSAAAVDDQVEEEAIALILGAGELDPAMALDGFCSFVANLALAARVHQAPRLYGDVLFHTDSSRTPIAATPAVARQAASGEDRVEARPRPRPRRSSLGRIWKRWRGAKELALVLSTVA
eukprot:s1269_g7.t1